MQLEQKKKSLYQISGLFALCLQGPLGTAVQGASLMVRWKPQNICVHESLSCVTGEVTMMSQITPGFFFLPFPGERMQSLTFVCVLGHNRTPAGTSQCTGLYYA